MPVIASSDLFRLFLLASTVAAGFTAIGARWPAQAQAPIKPDAKSALIAVDVQNCFIDLQGSLAAARKKMEEAGVMIIKASDIG